MRGLVEATGAIRIPEIVKLRLPPRQSRGVSQRTSAAKGHCASAGSHHGRFFMPWVRAIVAMKSNSRTGLIAKLLNGHASQGKVVSLAETLEPVDGRLTLTLC